MREILFRGKRKDNGEWAEGHLHVTHKGTYEIGYYSAATNIERLIYIVDPNTVGQFTGLLDKNGKRIFEGDILGSHYDDLYPDDVTVEMVEWFRNGWHIRQAGDYDPYLLEEEGTLPYSEIIGNIHDNPEMMGGGGADG